MYSRITGSSSQSTSASQADESRQSEDSYRFAETVAGTSAARPYSLVAEPPIDEIDRSSFMREVRDFMGGDIRHIAGNPQEYSNFVSNKAERAAWVAGGYASTYDNPSKRARFFRYQLGDNTVGLLRSGAGFPLETEEAQRRFPENSEVTSVLDLRITHPLVENAGDILLEHQLRLDGERPLVMSRPALDGIEPRLAEMGFVHMGDMGDWGHNCWGLDPTQHPEKWTKNANGEWQRADKPPLYLSKAESNDTDTEAGSEAYSSEADSSDDDPSWHLERAMRRLAMG
ncbi:host specificity protein [Bradyrhizobium iriomotense]|uniref:Host specificity protein n=1 Tax=Bradyrhizobium iriomotense TaxID=441950 RepID=A0ABQ6B8C4_9BRAD|nr:host specificity protein [Bradyrhizobium iriomotense]GLR90018.1 host specificity protein [Bradyrhizobium iriomotense]